MNKIWPLGLMWLLIACNNGSHDRSHIAKSIKAIGSWTATAQMVAEALQQGKIPAQYASQTLAKTRIEINTQVGELPEPPEVVARIQRVIDSLVEEIERPTGVKFTTALRELPNYRQQLTATAQNHP